MKKILAPHKSGGVRLGAGLAAPPKLPLENPGPHCWPRQALGAVARPQALELKSLRDRLPGTSYVLPTIGTPRASTIRTPRASTIATLYHRYPPCVPR